MKRVAVLSDTHLVSLGSGIGFLRDLRERFFPDADALLHAGDIIGADLLMAFDDLPVFAVRGNMDPPDSLLPIKRILQIEGKRVGLVHGFGAPGGMEERLLREFAGQGLDALVFGHTHYPLCLDHEGVLLFNPGSCTDRRRAPTHTLGILEIDETIRGYHIDID